MKSPLRLDSAYPSLAERYREADRHQQRQAALIACSAAVSQARLQGSDVRAALAALSSGNCSRSDLQKQLDRTSSLLDEEYFRLSEAAGTTPPKALLIFRQARAAAALAFALSDPEQFSESIYEAISASDNQAELVELVKAGLREEQ